MLDAESNYPQLREPSVQPQVQKKVSAARSVIATRRMVTLEAPSKTVLDLLHENNAKRGSERAFQIGASRPLDQHEASVIADAIADAIADFVPTNELGMLNAVQIWSPGAKAIRFRIDFTDDLPDDATFQFTGTVSSADAQELTGRQIKYIWHSERFFWAPVTLGDAQTIVVTMPPGTDAAMRSSFTVTAVSHLVYSPVEPVVEEILKSAGACEFDVACYPAVQETTTAKSVAKMLFSDTLGSYLCTGTLLVDADPRTYVPYFYTANHCINTQTVASSLITYWQYQATSCGSSVLASYQTLSLGSFLYSTSSTFDSTLLVLNQDAPASAVFSGWNADLVTATNPSTTIGIHHPAGDLKKLSRANSTLGYASYNGVGSFISVAWLSGVTEGGSSGSGLFTQTGANGSFQLRGGLKGGSSSCLNPGGLDSYSRLDLVYPSIQAYINGAVTPLTTLATVESSSLAVAPGTPITLTARMIILSGYPYATGTLTFYDGANVIGSGTLQPESAAYPYTVVSTMTTSSLSIGAHSISVAYAGDANFGPTSSAATTIMVGATNLLANAGFESGTVSWTQSSGGGYPIITNEASSHAGNYDAWLGGYNSGSDALFQSVAIPANVQSAFVQFWYKISTSESSTGLAYDSLTVDLYSVATGLKLVTLATLTNLNTTTGWRQSALFDVSAFKGQAIKLQFTALMDSTLVTNFRIDDVSLSAFGATQVTPQPAISMVNPASGQVGNTVTITGSNFAVGATVTVGGTNAIVTGPITSTSLQIVIPSVSAGSQNIVVNVNGVISAPVVFSVSATPTAPGAPTIGTATPGNSQAIIAFTPPASDGGSPIIGYTSTCNPGALTGSGTASPLTVGSLSNGTTYTCAVQAINAVGPGTSSAIVGVTPSAAALPVLIGVVSRKTHGAAGTFDLSIDTSVAIITGLVTVDPRTIGNGHTVVFQYNIGVSSAGTLLVVDGASAMVGASAIASGNNVIVTIPSLPDNQRVTVILSGVTTVNGATTPPPISLGFLIGDVNNTRSVNASDISGVKVRSGQATTALNFKFDVNVSGAINASDISAAKARSGLSLS